ncbi:MAG: hypothetical protein K2N69_08360, partial [Helicobacter sp.]|nr:hypothetical protein [Helicobacter sp.]
ISNLLVSNPLDEGIVIATSKGQDNITLVAGANHDVIEFNAGTGSSTGAREVYTVDLNNLRLGNNQSFSIDGLTISNVEGGIVRAAEIAQAIVAYVNNPSVQPSGFNITGKLGSLTGDWAGASVTASGGKLVITSTLERNIKDLALSFTGNDSTNAPANITANIVAGASAASSSITGLIETSPATPSADAKVADDTILLDSTQSFAKALQSGGGSTEATLKVTIGDDTFEIKLEEENGTTVTPTAANVVGLLNGTTTTISGLTVTIDSGSDWTAYKAALADNGISFESDSTTDTKIKLVVAADSTYSGTVKIEDDDSGTTTGDATWTIEPHTDAAPASYAFDFVGIGKAAQAYQASASAVSAKAAAVADDTILLDSTQSFAKALQSGGGSTEATLKVTIGDDTFEIKLEEENGTTVTPTAANVVGLLNGTTTTISGLTVTIDSGSDWTAYKAALADNGISFESDSTTDTKIKLVVAADSTYSGTVKIEDDDSGTTTGDATWTITPAVEASAAKPEIGTPNSVEPVNNNLVWTGKTVTTAQTQVEIFNITIAGTKFSVKGDIAANKTVDAADIISILGGSALTTNVSNVNIFNSVGGAFAGTLDTVLDNIGVAVHGSATGLASNEISFDIGTAGNLPENATTFTIVPSNVFNATNTAVNWSAQKEQGIPAQNGTHEVSINGHTITFSEVFLSAAQVRDAVFDLVTKGTLSALISDGTLPSDIASKVSIDNQAYSPANAKATVASFAIAGGVEYLKDGVAGIKLTDPTATNTISSEIVFSQTNTADGEVVAEQIYDLVGAHGDSYGQININFNALKAGQSYTFDGKTIIATKDLSANQVANAFTLTTDDTIDGAVVVSDFENIDNEGVLFYVANNSGTLVIQGTADAIIPEGIDTTITGTGALGVNTSGVSASTTQQGFDGSGSKADSYVIFATTSAEDGTITAVNANTAFVDSITNFDVGNDGLRLRDSEGGYYGQNNIGTIGNLSSIAVGDTTLTASVAGGVISFGTLEATTAEISLDAKLYVATHNVSNNRVTGFEHNGDFYVVATGNSNDSNITTDDIVVRLAGVSGIADITTILV